VSDLATEQRRASDPLGSAWVSANAGSGKTYVLAQRVVRLLLSGSDPSRILCLTFTKAAAAEMAKRVFGILAEWTRFGDDRLSDEIARIEGRTPAKGELVVARRLFARALETPGGLKIQTIHAFCEQLLHRFPFEANVAGHFEVLDDRMASALIADAQSSVLAKAGAEPGGGLGRALSAASAVAADVDIFRGIGECLGRRDRIAAWLEHCGGLDAALDALRRHLGLGEDETPEGIRTRILGEMGVGIAELRALAALLAASGTSDRAQAERLKQALTAGNAVDRVEAYCSFLFTDGGTPRKTLATKAVASRIPDVVMRLGDECARVNELKDRILAAEALAGTRAILTLAVAAIDAYQHEKARRGLLDFEDLVVRTARLLRQEEARHWVQYKLDQGLDHILVDEAQDTSPRQWEIIAALAEEFFSGAGARPVTRTLFAVGDEKQSIYSFQGAAPEWFARMRRDFRRKAERAELAWADVGLHVSFRSSPDLLAAIDRLFLLPQAASGLSSEGPPPPHTAYHRQMPGEVILWPPFVMARNEAPAEWTAPLDRTNAMAPENQVADRIARTIGEWLRAGTARAGDVLVLTRKRGVLHAALNRALKRAAIPVAGADRLALLDHIAVMDLLALGDVMLLPEDDLSLAALLKSPLLGLGEERLFDLAHKRKGTLWQALEEAAERDLEAAAIMTRLRDWRSRADYRSPYDFYARILAADGGRRAFAGRLGAEAEDVIDEFLAEALAYERYEPPSLQGFLAWMRKSETEIKRDPSAPRDEVRVMTVHGSKGLEAGTVFLVDDGSQVTHGNFDPRALLLGDDDDPSAPFIWFRGSRSAPPSARDRIDRVHELAAEEYHRLLYVATTRAKDRLVVCGIQRTGEGQWFKLVEQALGPHCVRVDAADGTVDHWRWPSEVKAAEARQAAAEAEAPPAGGGLPPWLRRHPGRPRMLHPRLSPSTAAPSGSAVRLPSPLERLRRAPSAALDRGRVMHRLLQALPDLAEAEREAAARRYLVQAAAQWPASDRAEALASVLAILADPHFAPVFAEGSRAEIAIAGTVEIGGRSYAVEGRIDRLAVNAERVLVVDYKTNEIAPETLAGTPRQYLSQLALYRALLRQLFPVHRVESAILWTGAPRLMEIPTEALDESMADLLTPA
jgi:ATP-dependent helicase/nuclease subunit A